MTVAEKLEKANNELAELEKAYKVALKAASWETKDGQSSRSVTNVSLSILASEIDKKKIEISKLECQLEGRSSKAFRVGVKW